MARSKRREKAMAEKRARKEARFRNKDKQLEKNPKPPTHAVSYQVMERCKEWDEQLDRQVTVTRPKYTDTVRCHGFYQARAAARRVARLYGTTPTIWTLTESGEVARLVHVDG